MVLVKCACGCFFTLKTEGLKNHHPRKCPNCNKAITLDEYTTLNDATEILPSDGICVKIVPEDAKISVAFTM